MAKREVPITYRKSFTAKYILSDDRVKYVYETLKNKLMSIRGMKSRISWFYDAFNVGRINFAKLSVRGKYVALYLNLNVNDYPMNIYHQENVTDRRRYKETCFKIHVKSNRTIKYAFRLIDEEIKKFNLKAKKRLPKENYYLPYEEEIELVKRGLIKLEPIKPPKRSEQLYMDLSDIILSEDLKSMPIEEIKPIENTEIEPEIEEKTKNPIIFVSGNKVFIKERKSFYAKLVESDDFVKESYSKIKNKLLSFTRIKSRMSWKYEAFSLGKIKLSKLQIRGKYLVLYLALDTSKYKLSKVKSEDVSKYETFSDTPLMIRLKDQKRIDIALNLIDDLRKRFLLEEGFIQEEINYAEELKDRESLVEAGQIKTYAKVDDFTEEELKQIKKEYEDAKINKKFPVYKEEQVLTITIDDNNEFVETFETVRVPLEGERDIIFLDQINDNFKNGDIVDLNKIKAKKLLKESIKFYKVMYRGGTFKKKLAIKAQAFSKAAEKVITNNGSTFIIEVED